MNRKAILVALLSAMVFSLPYIVPVNAQYRSSATGSGNGSATRTGSNIIGPDWYDNTLTFGQVPDTATLATTDPSKYGTGLLRIDNGTGFGPTMFKRVTGNCASQTGAPPGNGILCSDPTPSGGYSWLAMNPQPAYSYSTQYPIIFPGGGAQGTYNGSYHFPLYGDTNLYTKAERYVNISSNPSLITYLNVTAASPTATEQPGFDQVLHESGGDITIHIRYVVQGGDTQTLVGQGIADCMGTAPGINCNNSTTGSPSFTNLSLALLALTPPVQITDGPGNTGQTPSYDATNTRVPFDVADGEAECPTAVSTASVTISITGCTNIDISQVEYNRNVPLHNFTNNDQFYRTLFTSNTADIGPLKMAALTVYGTSVGGSSPRSRVGLGTSDSGSNKAVRDKILIADGVRVDDGSTNTSDPGLGNLTLSGGITGRLDGSNATSGFVGYVVRSNIAQGSPVPLTTNTPADVTTITLGKGDFDLHGAVCFTSSGSPTGETIIQGWIGEAAATVPTQNDLITSTTGPMANQITPSLNSPAIDRCLPVPIGHIYLTASTTTIRLGARANFTGGATGAYGWIWARQTTPGH